MLRIGATLICLAALAVPTPASAQSGVTLKGGFSYSDVTNRGVLPGNPGARSGFAVGLSVGSEARLLGFRAEALYAQRGVTNDTPIDSRKIAYLDVPVMVQVMLPLPLAAPFAYAGPQASFEMSCHAGALICPTADRPTTSFAGVIGGGVRLGVIGALSLEGRYIYGLTDLKLGTVTSGESYKSRSLLILVGLGF